VLLRPDALRTRRAEHAIDRAREIVGLVSAAESAAVRRVGERGARAGMGGRGSR
jgi:hypothetical protein